MVFRLLGPNLDEDVFYLTVEIEPLGRPDKNVECTGSDDSHTHGQNYILAAEAREERQEKVCGQYRTAGRLPLNYVVGEDGTAAVSSC